MGHHRGQQFRHGHGRRWFSRQILPQSWSIHFGPCRGSNQRTDNRHLCWSQNSPTWFLGSFDCLQSISWPSLGWDSGAWCQRHCPSPQWFQREAQSAHGLFQYRLGQLPWEGQLAPANLTHSLSGKWCAAWWLLLPACPWAHALLGK